MGILAAYAVPHPPLIVPAVGRGEERAIQATVDAYEEVGRRIAAHHPDVLIISSPHAPYYRDAFFVSSAEEAQGDMSRFRAPEERLSVACDDLLAEAIRHGAAEEAGLPIVSHREVREELDHGTYVPLYFVKDRLDEMAIVRIGLSMLPWETHRELGRAIRSAVDALDRRAVYIASGDLSQKLEATGPYGFDPEGPKFDTAIEAIFASGDLERLFELDPQMCEDAAECGLRSFQIMAGAIEGLGFEGELLSHEGPFGVGYGVAAFESKQ